VNIIRIIQTGNSYRDSDLKGPYSSD